MVDYPLLFSHIVIISPICISLQHCAASGCFDTLLHLCIAPLGLRSTVESGGGTSCGHLQAALVAQPALHPQLLWVQRDVSHPHPPSGHRHGTVRRGAALHLRPLALAASRSIRSAAPLHGGHGGTILYDHCESALQLYILWHQVSNGWSPFLYPIYIDDELHS